MKKKKLPESENTLTRRWFIRTTTLAGGAAFVLSPYGCQPDKKATVSNIRKNSDSRKNESGAILKEYRHVLEEPG